MRNQSFTEKEKKWPQFARLCDMKEYDFPIMRYEVEAN